MPTAAHIELSIIITGKNSRHLVRQAFDSLSNIKNINYEALYVDDASEDDSADIVAAEYPHARVIRNAKNLGFAAANNRGIQVASGNYLLLMNVDAEILPNTAERCIEAMNANHKIAVLGCVLLNSDGSFQGGYGNFPTYHNTIRNLTGQVRGDYEQWKANFAYEPVQRPVDWISGAFFLIRRQALEELGCLDERYFFYVEELDFCYRAHLAGWENSFLTDVQVMHHHRQSSQKKGSKISSLVAHSIRGQLMYAWSYYQRSEAIRLSFVAFFVCLGMILKGMILVFSDRNRLTAIQNGFKGLYYVFETFGGVATQIPKLSSEVQRP